MLLFLLLLTADLPPAVAWERIPSMISRYYSRQPARYFSGFL